MEGSLSLKISTLIDSFQRLIVRTPQGLYCPVGDFYLDPHLSVPRAVISHGHMDHVCSGIKEIYSQKSTAAIVSHRLKSQASKSLIKSVEYYETIRLGEAEVTLVPAGHILGSAQIVIQHKGSTWVYSGDYKTQKDPTCESYVNWPCDVFITETTFALPHYKWQNPESISDNIVDWVKREKARNRTPILFSYSLGKSQRLLSLLHGRLDHCYVHSAIDDLNNVYREHLERPLLDSTRIDLRQLKDIRNELWIMPPALMDKPALSKIGTVSVARVSGWMQTRGRKTREGGGFILSDHADYDGLVESCLNSKAKLVLTHHGYAAVFSKVLSTMFGVESAPIEALPFLGVAS